MPPKDGLKSASLKRLESGVGCLPMGPAVLRLDVLGQAKRPTKVRVDKAQNRGPRKSDKWTALIYHNVLNDGVVACFI